MKKKSELQRVLCIAWWNAKRGRMSRNVHIPQPHHIDLARVTSESHKLIWSTSNYSLPSGAITTAMATTKKCCLTELFSRSTLRTSCMACNPRNRAHAHAPGDVYLPANCDIQLSMMRHMHDCRDTFDTNFEAGKEANSYRVCPPTTV